MRIDNLPAPLGRFVARVSSSVTTVDRRPGHHAIFPTADPGFASVYASRGGAGSAEAPATAKTVAQHLPSPTSTLQGADSAAIIDPVVFATKPPGNPAPLVALPPSDRISTRTRRRTTAATGTAAA